MKIVCKYVFEKKSLWCFDNIDVYETFLDVSDVAG